MIKKLAVIGCGNWGKNLVRVFCQLLGSDAVVLYDQDQTRTGAMVTQFPGVSVVPSLDQIWADASITSVAIATPPVTHYNFAMQALRHDKHIFVEKPLATNVSDAEELRDLAEKSDRVLVVDHLLLFHPALSEMENRLRAGELGDLYYFYSQRLNLGVVRSEENVLWSLGAHDIAVALRLFKSLPLHVSAHGRTYIQSENGIQDVVFVTIAFSDTQMAHLHLSWLDPHKIRRITLVGSQRIAVFDDMEPSEKLRIHDKGVRLTSDQPSPQVRYGEITVPSVPMQEPLVAVCKHFLKCVSQQEEPISDGSLGLDVVRVLDAAQTSLDHGGMAIEIAKGLA